MNNKSNPTTTCQQKTIKCAVCDLPGHQVCSGCMSTSYCSPEHQKLDWKVHSQACKNYIIKSNEKYGRYVVASKDLEAGSIIMNEPILIYGPKTNARPLCLGCHKLLLCSQSSSTSTTSMAYNCSRCKFPMCGPDCEKIPIHANNECIIFDKYYNLPFPKIKNYAVHHPIYECILPLRILLLKSTSPKIWKKIIAMMHHNEARQRLADVWYKNHVNIVKLLIDHCQLSKLYGFNEIDIHSVIGYVDVNAFEVLINDNAVAGLFHNTYIMSHECASNTHHTFTSDLRMVVRAATSIKCGEQITTLYANILEGTIDRLAFLQDSKYFSCTCARCSDPTELSTYFSGIKCQNSSCSDGYLLPIQPLNIKSSWACSKCSTQIPIELVNKIIGPIKDVLKKREKNFNHKDIKQKLELILKKYGNILHPNHYLIIQVTYVLIDLYGKNGKKLKFGELKRKEALCEHFLEVLNMLSPGLSRLRALIMYELQSVIYLHVQNEIKTIPATTKPSTLDTGLKGKLGKVVQLLEESHKILSLDSPQSKEGQIASTIPTKLKNVKEMMQEASV